MPNDISPAYWFLADRENGDYNGNLFTSKNNVVALIDGQAFMKHLLETIKATEGPDDFIHLVGWEIFDSIELDPPDNSTTILSVLTKAVVRKVVVRVMLSGHIKSEVNSETRGKFEAAGIQCVYDSRRNGISGSIHQKFITILTNNPSPTSQQVRLHGYCGGIDLTYDRWDTPEHNSPSARHQIKYFPAGWHDVHTYFYGYACQDLERSFRERWNNAQHAGDLNTPHDPIKFNGHATVEPPIVFGDEIVGNHHVQMLRTYPCKKTMLPFARNGEMSARLACIKAIANAERLIYIEDQYFYSYEIATALITALSQKSNLRVIVLVANEPTADPNVQWENYYRNATLQYMKKELTPNDAWKRFSIYSLKNTLGEQIYVHAKLMIVDDIWVEIGSVNCNRRSMTNDYEMAVAILDEETVSTTYLGDVCKFAFDLRQKLWMRHLSIPAASPLASDMMVPETGFDLWEIRAGMQGVQATKHDTAETKDRRNRDFPGWLPLVASFFPVVDAFVDPVVHSSKSDLWRNLQDLQGTCTAFPIIQDPPDPLP